ncbi:MAG TPA: OmpA family protein [Alphaproteobacteria bacterium]|nr:OmpA family protein [Alphaproteobacteria bacterium]
MTGAAQIVRLMAGVGVLAPALIAAEPVGASEPLPARKPVREAATSQAPSAILATIGFSPEEMELGEDARRDLTAVAGRLAKEDRSGILLLAYAGTGGATMSARRISLGRALAVRSFLIKHGVSGGRMTVRAFDFTAGAGPADRVDIVRSPS